jgi:ribosome-associated protein YbcJ (S4-like RNA binding protein)
MSQRNTLINKRVRRMRRAITKGRVPAYIDLIHWLKLRGIAQTTGQAVQMLKDGRVRSESHKLGVRIIKIGEGDERRKVEVLDPLVSARLRDSLEFV